MRIPPRPTAADGDTPLDRVMAHRPDIWSAMCAVTPALDRSELDPALQALAALVVARRSAYLSGQLRPAAVAAGLGEEAFEAVQEEDWTASVLTALQKAVLRFAMMYDAGYGIGNSVFDEVAASLGPGGMVELCALCTHWGGMARLAIAVDVGADGG